jgi:hypothetical protein
VTWKVLTVRILVNHCLLHFDLQEQREMLENYYLTLDGLMGTAMNCHLSHLVLGFAFFWSVSAV